jgi:hypothetical protein
MPLVFQSGCKSTILFQTCKPFLNFFFNLFFQPAKPEIRCFAGGKDRTFIRFLQIFFKDFFSLFVPVFLRASP